VQRGTKSRIAPVSTAGKDTGVDDLLARADAWRRSDPDPETAEELAALVSRREIAELRERFAGPLAFGTAGLRGLIGAGPARVNRAVVRRAAAGLARYLLATVPDARRRGVAVGRDARRQSDVFADEAAGVLAAAGIPVLVFPSLAATPLVAFAVRHLGAAAGVMITASHNPPEYNGLKLWWGNGAQVIPPHDAGIAAQIDQAPAADAVPRLGREEAIARGVWRDLGEDVASAYRRALGAIPLHAGAGRDLKIVYTALHGVGMEWVPDALAVAGFTHLHVVPEQARPDPRFPTVRSPNPEEAGTLDLALALAERVKADLVLATDPDADRLAVAARDSSGRLLVLSGNDIGTLLGHERITHASPRPARPLVITSVVSSPLLGVIARAEGVLHEETLTGFKWIGNRALEIEAREGATFLFGYEEALGFAIGQAVRDKDGIGAAVAMADLAGWCRMRSTTVVGVLEEIQRRYGLFLSASAQLARPGVAGAAAITAIMERLRADPPREIGGVCVAGLKDYQRASPSSDLLVFALRDGGRVAVRPSGTEPKIKLYFDLREEVARGERLSAARARGEARLERLRAAFLAVAGGVDGS
jgi:phosphomannomutase